MNEIERLQHLAGIVRPINEDGETADSVEKTVVGHVDDEKDMLMKELYQAGKYCVELHKMLKNLPDNVDFPHWWQSKLVKAFDYIGMTKHYLENEINAPSDEASKISPEVTDDQDPSGVS